MSLATTLVQTDISSNNSREDWREILYRTFVICMNITDQSPSMTLIFVVLSETFQQLLD